MEIDIPNPNHEDTDVEPVPISVLLPSPSSVPSRYEQQKKRDWRTFSQYLNNHDPPIPLSAFTDDGMLVIEYLKHFDQFGKTKWHVSDCVNYGRTLDPPVVAACDCPVRQAWGSLDSLVGRLRAAYEENGGHYDSNPFAAKPVSLYLKGVRDEQARARGVKFEKKRKSRGTTASRLDLTSGLGSNSMVGIPQVVHDGDGRVVGSVLVVGGSQSGDASSASVSGSGSTLVTGISRVFDGSAADVEVGSTSVPAIGQVVDGCSSTASGTRSTSTGGVAQVDDSSGAASSGGDSTSASEVVPPERMVKFRFITETQVEVNLRDKQCHGAWFPATILKEINQDLFMVGYKQRLSDEEWCSKAIMDARHIRPSPPENFEGKDFAVSEKVDAYYDCGWWSGKVTEVLAGNRYIVCFTHQKIGREFKQLELRCHMEWVNKNWVPDSWDIDTPFNQDLAQRTDHKHFSPACEAADVANGSNNREQNIDLPTPKSNLEISPPCTDLKKAEGPDDLRKHPENEMLTSTASNPPGASIDHSEHDFGQEILGSVLDTPKRNLKSSSPSTALKKAEVAEQSFLKTHTEKEMPTRTASNPSERLSDRSEQNFSQEILGNLLDCDRSWSPPTINDLKLLPFFNIEGEQHDSPKTQVEGLQKILAVESSPTCIQITDPQRCSRTGTGWRCYEMALPGKRHCAKHQLLQDNYNRTRRSRSRDHSSVEARGSEKRRNSNAGHLLLLNQQQCGGEDMSIINNQVEVSRTDIVQLSLVHSTADIPNGSNSRKQNIEPTVLESNNKISPPCNKLKIAEVSEGSLFSTTHSEKEAPTSTFSSPSEGLSDHPVLTSGQEKLGCSLESDRSGIRPTIDDFSLSPHSTVEGERNNLSSTHVECLQKNLVAESSPHSIQQPDQQRCRRTGTGWRCHEMALPGKGCCEKHQTWRDDYNKKRRTRLRERTSLLACVNDKKINSNGDPLRLFDHQQSDKEDINTKHNQVDLIRADQAQLSPVHGTANIASGSDSRKQNIEPGTFESNGKTLPACNNLTIAEVSESSLFLIAHPEKENPVSATPSSSERTSGHAALSFGQEKIGSALFCDRSGSQPTISYFSLSPLFSIEREHNDLSKTHVECLQKDLVDFSPYSIKQTDQQQCRRMGKAWRCPEMASPGKHHCKKHLLEQSIRNEKRRRLSREQERICLEPFVPTDNQQCRRTGTGWRCPEMTLPGKRFCEKHQFLQDIYNEKRRNIASEKRKDSDGVHLHRLDQREHTGKDIDAKLTEGDPRQTDQAHKIQKINKEREVGKGPRTGELFDHMVSEASAEGIGGSADVSLADIKGSSSEEKVVDEVMVDENAPLT